MYFDCQGQLIPASLCGEGTAFDSISGQCRPIDDDIASEEACGPLTVWNAELELCVPEFISAACYFDTDQNGRREHRRPAQPSQCLWPGALPEHHRAIENVRKEKAPTFVRAFVVFRLKFNQRRSRGWLSLHRMGRP